MNEPRIITLDEIVAYDDLPEEVVEIPEWGGLAVRIRGMTKAQEMEVRREAMASGDWDPDVWELALVTRCVVEPAGLEAAIIRGKSAGPVQRILKRVLALSGLNKGATEAAKKTFPAGPDGDVRVRSGAESEDDPRGAVPADGRPGDDAMGGLLRGEGGAGDAGAQTG